MIPPEPQSEPRTALAHLLDELKAFTADAEDPRGYALEQLRQFHHRLVLMADRVHDQEQRLVNERDQIQSELRRLRAEVARQQSLLRKLDAAENPSAAPRIAADDSAAAFESVESALRFAANSARQRLPSARALVAKAAPGERSEPAPAASSMVAPTIVSIPQAEASSAQSTDYAVPNVGLAVQPPLDGDQRPAKDGILAALRGLRPQSQQQSQRPSDPPCQPDTEDQKRNRRAPAASPPSSSADPRYATFASPPVRSMDAAGPSSSVRPSRTKPDAEPYHLAGNPVTEPRDWGIPVRWWNVGGLLLVATVFCLGLTWASVESLRANDGLITLRDAMTKTPAQPRRVEKLLAERHESPLARYDGRRDYLVARALAFLETERSSLYGDAPTNGKKVDHNLRRAVERNPANTWYRLSLARSGEQLPAKEGEQDRRWRAVQLLAVEEPLYWERMAAHWQSKGETSKTLAAYQHLLNLQPSQAGAVIEKLLAAGIGPADALTVLPPSAVAAASALVALQGRQTDERELAQRMLTQIEQNATKKTPEELAARAELLQRVGELTRAIDALKGAVAQAGNNAWRLRLAELQYENKDYPASAALIDRVIEADPAGELADRARGLRERIALATGARLGN